MANRRQLDSSPHVAVIRSTYFQFKTLLLSLAFVSLLISIHCASFGHRSVDQQQAWQQNRKPEYPGEYSESVLKDEVNLGNLLNYQPFVVKQPAVEQSLEQEDDQQRHASAEGYDLGWSTKSDSRSSPSSVKDLLALLKVPSDDEKDNSLRSSSLYNLDYQLSSDPSSFSSDDRILSDYETKLVEQLLRDNSKLSPSTGQSLNNLDDDSKNLRYFLPDQSTYSDELNDKITLGRDVQERSGSTSDKDIYKLSVEDGTQTGEDVAFVANNADSLMSAGNAVDTNKTYIRRNLTTLLEDEEVSTQKPTEDGVSTESSVTSTSESPTSTPDLTTTTTEATYGSVVTASSELHDKSYKNSMSSMLSQFYSKLVGYLPEFMKIWPGHQHGAAASNGGKQNHISASELLSAPVVEEPASRDKSSSNSSENANDKPASDEKTLRTNPKTDDNETQADSSMTLDSRVPPMSPATTSDDLDNSKLGTWNWDSSRPRNTGSRVLIDATNKRQSGDFDDPLGLEDDDDERDISYRRKESKLHRGRGHRVSMVRQSSVVLPIESDHELIIQSDESTHPTGLLGKYIYAPEHHYHLNTAPAHQPTGKRVDIDDEQQLYTQQMSQRSYLRRLHPGDSVYSSYTGSFNPMYEPTQVHATNQPLSGLVSDNKTNDVYFLVMVAAFCAMAMAVVLAAGLFAYRVQQNRKTTVETDYPTYGVVGPNNMNGKCGAASFVGGYFGATGGPGSSSTCGSSKTGSVKQLADLYCGDTIMSNGLGPNGNNNLGNSKSKKASSDSGGANNNRTDFMANQNAARMYHYQHQKQQMIISDRTSAGRHTSASDLDSEDENDDGTYTVYECPGLASAHEMEIKNPLFNDDQTP